MRYLVELSAMEVELMVNHLYVLYNTADRLLYDCTYIPSETLGSFLLPDNHRQEEWMSSIKVSQYVKEKTIRSVQTLES